MGSMRRDRDVTKQPASDARSSSLHRRLTVALANASDRACLAELIARDLGAVGAEGTFPLVRSEDLWQAADGFAQERSADRKALRSRLDAVAARSMHDCDTARHQLEHLMGWTRTLREGAQWASGLHAELPEHIAVVETARNALDERRAEQRACRQALERVLEQRSAATAAIEDADQELADLACSGMDESGLRRELEAAGQAVQEAQQVHARARAGLEELQLEATGLQVRREAAGAGSPTDAVDESGVAAVREALTALQLVTIDGEVDPGAIALADAWSDLSADLAELAEPGHGPSDADLAAARTRAEEATARLAELDAAVSASAITPEQRAELDAAHTAVLTAEEQTGRRRGAAAARKRLEKARAAERELLDQHGFGGYLDVVLTGGRSAAVDPNRAVVERERFEANLALQTIERAAGTSPELEHLRSESDRLLKDITDLLGVDPGTEVVTLLRRHRPLAESLQQPIVDALAAVGIRPVGISLEDAALAFLEAYPLPDPEESPAPPDNERHVEMAAIEARSAALEAELEAAQAEVDRSAEALQMAERSVGAFESELSVRAGEDLQRMKRFSAAEQLRAQIDSVAATLRRAEQEAQQGVDTSDQAVAAAESEFEQAATVISDLARQARKLAEELPIDQRPTGDPLRGLVELAERLEAHAGVVQPEIGRASCRERV